MKPLTITAAAMAALALSWGAVEAHHGRGSHTDRSGSPHERWEGSGPPPWAPAWGRRAKDERRELSREDDWRWRDRDDRRWRDRDDWRWRDRDDRRFRRDRQDDDRWTWRDRFDDRFRWR